MSRKATVKVQPYSFHLAMRAIRKFEKQNDAIVINNMVLSDFLQQQAEIGKSSIPIEVRIILLETYGHHDPDENMIKAVKDSKEMSDFDFSGILYISLTGQLNELIHRYKPTAGHLSNNAVQNCDTVGELVALVISMI